MKYYSFSENLRKQRKEKKLTQEELAKSIGVSQQTIAAWENNERYPTIDKVYDLAKYLNIPVSKLIENNVLCNKSLL